MRRTIVCSLVTTTIVVHNKVTDFTSDCKDTKLLYTNKKMGDKLFNFTCKDCFLVTVVARRGNSLSYSVLLYIASAANIS